MAILVLILTNPNESPGADLLEMGLTTPDILGSLVATVEDTGACEIFWSHWLTEQEIHRVHYDASGGPSAFSVLDISNTQDQVNSLVVSVNREGTGLLVWTGQHGLYSSRREAGGDWQPPVPISTRPSPFSVFASNLGLGVDSKGNGLLTWADDNGNRIFGSEYIAGSGWKDPVPLGDRGLAREELPFAMNADGRAILLWGRWVLASGWTLVASSFVPGRGWLAAQPIYSSPVYTSPAVAMNDTGTAVAVWLEKTTAWPETHLYSAQMRPNEDWQPHVLVARDNLPRQPRVEVNAVGDAVVSWRTAFDFSIAANHFLADGEWQGPQVLTSIFLSNPIPQPSYLDDQGNIICTWSEEKTPSPRIGPLALRRYDRASGWGEVEVLPFVAPVKGGVIGDIQLKFNREGSAVAVWTESYSNQGIVYSDLYAHRFWLPSPTLDVRRSETHLTLSWPALAEGFRLEGSPLLNPSSWDSLSEPPHVIDGRNSVTLPSNGREQYYRLRK